MKKTLIRYRAALIALALFTLTITVFAQVPAVSETAPPAVVVPDAPAVAAPAAAAGGFINWATTNWQGIIAAFMGVIIAARLIVKLTPTPKDDSALEKFIEMLKHVGLHIDPNK